MSRRLAGRFETRPMAAINLTPLVPVLLGLFAMMAVVAARPGEAVNLHVEPGSVPAPYDPLAKIPPPIVISLKQDGVFVDKDRFSTSSEAVTRAGLLARARHARVVSVRADADVPYARAAEIVRRLSEAGLSAQFLNEELH